MPFGALGNVRPFLWSLHATELLVVGGLSSPFLTLRSWLCLLVAFPVLKALVYVAASFVVSDAHRHKEGATPLTALAALRVFAQEVSSFIRLTQVVLPFGGPTRGPIGASRGKSGRQGVGRPGLANCPVLFIHGYMCSGAQWRPTMAFLRSHGLQHLYSMDLAPFWLGIREFARGQVAGKVREILRETHQDKIILVGGSMGGLVARTYVHLYGGRSSTAKIITVGSAHHGTAVADFAIRHGGLGPHKNKCVMEMTPKSKLLRELNDMEAVQGPDGVPITSIFSWNDNFVSPQDSPALHHRHCKNVTVSGLGHVSLAFSREIHKAILEDILAVSEVERN